MATDIGIFWALVIGAFAMTGWWLSLRPNANYRGAASTVSLLIVVMAVLLCMLAVRGQSSPPRHANATTAIPR